MKRKFKHKFHQYQQTNNHFSSLTALQMIKKPAQIHFHSKRPHTMTMNDNINMNIAIAESINTCS